jgi:hypothetical protein
MKRKSTRRKRRKESRHDTTFSDSLKQQGPIVELRALSVKRQIAKELAEAMRLRKLTVQQTARTLKTTPTQIKRLLDWNDEDVKVDVLIRAAFVIGRERRISLTDGRDN